MPDAPRHPRLLRGRDHVLLDLPPDCVPGRVERVEVLDGSEIVSTTVFVDGDTTRPGLLRLRPWAREPADPTIVIFSRRPPPGGGHPALLTRSSFLLERAHIKDGEMTQDASPRHRTSAPEAGPKAGVNATLDFGTSRSVAAIFDRRDYTRHADGSLSSDGVVEAVKRLDLGDQTGDVGLLIEMETVGDPDLRAEVWRAVLSCPPANLHLKAGDKVRSSDLVCTDRKIDFADEAAGQDGTRLRGAKRHLGQDLGAPIPDVDLTAGELFTQVYARFLELVRTDVGLTAPVDRLHVTYPTKLPPDRREALRGALRGLAEQVEMEVDEASAVAGFVLMKRFGADPALGVEAFKLRARCPEGYRAWDEPPPEEKSDVWYRAREWHENMLIVDVGGGTTDCVLLKVGVADVTPTEAGAAGGRYHRLRPEILSSGGRLHLGGDLITLEIFRALKALLGVPESATVFDGVSKDQVTLRRTAFDAVWAAAEQVKHLGLRGPAPVDVHVTIEDGPPAGPDQRSAGRREVVIATDSLPKGPASSAVVTAAMLTRIVAGAVDRICPLAAGVAAGGLEVVRFPAKKGLVQAVDRVVLSGGSMMAPSLRAAVEDGLRLQFEADGLDATFEVEFDPRYCKAGTALGGMYLNAVVDTNPPGPDSTLVIDRLREGVSYFQVDPSRLRSNLAADFYTRRDMIDLDERRPVFRRGQALEVDEDALVGESRYAFPILPEIDVYRFDTPDSPDRGGDRPEALWASYELTRELTRELHKADVTVRFRIDQDERITLVLARGRPIPQLTGGTTVTPVQTPAEGLVKDGFLTRDLCVDVYQAGYGVQKPHVVAVQGSAVPLVVPLAGMSEVRYAETDPGSDDVRHLPLVDDTGGRGWLSVDGSGMIRTHARRPQPPSVPGDDPAGLLTAEPGTVFMVPLTSKPLYDKAKDPFSGVH